MKKRDKKIKARKIKEKSVLRKVIEILWEQAQRRKALRILSTQQWSLDFLSYLLVKASRLQQHSIELVITSPDGTTMRLSSNGVSLSPTLDTSDDIFNHLDEPEVVEAYIKRHGR